MSHIYLLCWFWAEIWWIKIELLCWDSTGRLLHHPCQSAAAAVFRNPWPRDADTPRASCHGAQTCRQGCLADRAGLPGCQYQMSDTREANENALWATEKMADEHTKDVVTFCFTEIIEGPDSLLVTNKGDKTPVAALLSRFELDCFFPLNSCFFLYVCPQFQGSLFTTCWFWTTRRVSRLSSLKISTSQTMSLRKAFHQIWVPTFLHFMLWNKWLPYRTLRSSSRPKGLRSRWSSSRFSAAGIWLWTTRRSFLQEKYMCLKRKATHVRRWVLSVQGPLFWQSSAMIGHCWQTRVVSRQALPNCLARQLCQNAVASQGFKKCNHWFERREGELARLEGELARREGELARQVKFKFEAVNSMMVSLLAQESQINWFQATICQSVFSPLSRFLFCSQGQFSLPCLQCTHSCCCCCWLVS